MILSRYFTDHKRFFTWPYLLALVILCGCDQTQKKPVAGKNNKITKSDTTISLHRVKPAAADTSMPADCPRGAAEPVVKKSVFTDAHFALQKDGMTGIETLTLSKGDKVKITQSGCEYYILKFQIETSRFAADTTDLAYWANTALVLMREVYKGISTPLEINKGLDKLSERIQAGPSNPGTQLKLGDEIDFGGPDPREYLTIDRVSQPAKQRYLMEITFSYGPI